MIPLIQSIIDSISWRTVAQSFLTSLAGWGAKEVLSAVWRNFVQPHIRRLEARHEARLAAAIADPILATKAIVAAYASLLVWLACLVPLTLFFVFSMKDQTSAIIAVIFCLPLQWWWQNQSYFMHAVLRGREKAASQPTIEPPAVEPATP